MSVEESMLATLEAATDPALMAARKFYGYAPQDDEKFPTDFPLLILQRTNATWDTTTCGTIVELCFVEVVVVHLAINRDACREQATAAMLVLCTSADRPALESENEAFDSDAGAWTVTQTYRTSDP